MRPKRECPAAISPSAGTGLEGPKKLHRAMQQTAAVGFSRADCRRTSKQGRNFSFQAGIGVNPETTSQVIARQDFARLTMSWQQSEENVMILVYESCFAVAYWREF